MSEPERSLALLREHRSVGVLIDTNLLLLYFIGAVDPDGISSNRRTQKFDEKDYTLLMTILTHVEKLVVTPHVAAEVSNLSRSAGISGEKAERLATLLKQFLRDAEERGPVLQRVIRTPGYDRLGVTDAGIACIKRRLPLVLTDDLPLSIELGQQGRAVINFSHLQGLL